MILLTMLEALHVLMNGHSGITSDAGVGTRIYRGHRPQTTSTLPAIVYRKVSGQDALYQTGTSTLAHLRVEVTCYAATPAVAETVRNAVRDACQRYSGTISHGGESVQVVLISIEDDAEFFDAPQDAGIEGVFSAVVDLMIWWRPPAPTG